MELLESVASGIFLSSPTSPEKGLDDTTVTYVNPFFAALFRSSREEFIGGVILPERYWAVPSNRKGHLSTLLSHSTAQGIEVELRRSDGNHFWVRLSGKVLSLTDGRFRIQGTLTDISIQKDLEKDLRLCRDRLQVRSNDPVKKAGLPLYESRPGNPGLRELMEKVTYLEAVKDQMARFLPKTVKNAIEENPGADLGKQEKDVSILLLDILGCSTLCEDLSHKDMNYLIERYFAAFLDVINSNHGDVNETMGDGLMAIYQSEDKVKNALNATRSSLAILEETRRLNEELKGNFPSILVKIGISSGIASVGLTKFNGLTGKRWTYTASGPVTNLASRLCSAVEEASILIDEETAKRTSGLIRVKELGRRQFRNIKTPETVFMVIGEGGTGQFSASTSEHSAQTHHRESEASL